MEFSMTSEQVKSIVGLTPVDLSLLQATQALPALSSQGWIAIDPRAGLASQFYSPIFNQYFPGMPPRIGDRILEFSASSTDFISALGMQARASTGRGALVGYMSGGLTFPPCR